jgi:hypothetical protein
MHLASGVTSRPEIDRRTTLEPLTSLNVSLHNQSGLEQDINYVNSAVYSDKRLLWFAQDGTVSAGSLEDIAARVVDESKGSSTDHPLESTFLTTYQLFSTSIRLFEIVKRCFESTLLDPTDTRSQYAYVNIVFPEKRL